MRRLRFAGLALTLVAAACGIRGPPRPASSAPTIPSSMQQQSFNRDVTSRAPLESSGTPPVLQTPPPLEPIPDGGLLDPFRP